MKTVDRTTTHTAKRNTDGLAPNKAPAVTGNRRGGANVSGNEAGMQPRSPPASSLSFVLTGNAAYRDRNAGRDSNRGKSTDEAPRGGRRGGFRGGKLQSCSEETRVPGRTA